MSATVVPGVDDVYIDALVEVEMECICDKFPDCPCKNELTGIDGFCDECRPACQWAPMIRDENCCGAKIAPCRLVPLIGTEDKVHVDRRRC